MPTDTLHKRKCTKCGIQLAFIQGEGDKLIPAQEVRVVYKYDNQTHRLVKANLGAGRTFINHWEGCPHASYYAQRRKKK